MSSSIQDYLVLPTIVFAQFAGTSLWFAPNAVISQIDGFGERETAALVSCVQAGFILGTLGLTYSAATDRISPPLLFSIMTLIGAGLNVLCLATNNFIVWIIIRILVGICLAGVYPVGMKIAATEYPSGLGARLGVLVGALTLGTAFPWLVRGLGGEELPVAATLASVSCLAVSGAILMGGVMIPRQGGPGSGWIRSFCKKPDDDVTKMTEDQVQSPTPTKEDSNDHVELGEASNHATEEDPVALTGFKALRAIFEDSRFRAAAFGYFGHMWELYALWAHVPSLIESHADHSKDHVLNHSLTSFCTIGIGALSCALGGLWSLRAGRNIHPGSAVVAQVSLLLSGACCLLAPTYRMMSPHPIFYISVGMGSCGCIRLGTIFKSMRHLRMQGFGRNGSDIVHVHWFYRNCCKHPTCRRSP